MCWVREGECGGGLLTTLHIFPLVSSYQISSIPVVIAFLRYMYHINSLHATGTFMCPRNAPALRDGHIYVPSDLVHNIGCAATKLG